MKSKISNINIWKLIVYLYLYLPVCLFLLTWVKWYIGIPVFILSIFSLFSLLNKDSKINSSKSTAYSNKMFFYCILVLVILFIWCMFSGFGGSVSQAGDWQKHNVLLKDLINREWPVRYEYNGKQGVMAYYIGEYLVPALAGKIFGHSFDVAQLVLYYWVVLGLFTICINLYKFAGEGHPAKLLLICFGLIMFATFICPLSGIYRVYFPGDVSDGTQWISKSIFIQYSSNITLLRWVFPQFVPTGVAVSFLLLHRKDYKEWGAVCVPVILYSTFAFLGMAAILVLLFFMDLLENKKEERNNLFKELFSRSNLLSLVLGSVLVIFIGGNILQQKPETANMGLKVIDYSNHIWTLITFEASWVLWLLILLKREHKNKILYAAAICLFVLPFFTMGEWNDLCMRASIPALLILCFLVIKNLLLYLRSDRFYAGMLILCLVLCGIGNIREFRDAIIDTVADSKNYNDCFEKGEDFFDSAEFIKWQYVDWEPDGIIRFILKD